MRCNDCGIDLPVSMFSAGSETCYECRLRYAESNNKNSDADSSNTSNKIHTHYDNLKVVRNAPIEVIRAAYKSLSQKFHPDTNKDPDAERVMKIINAAYETLSDPEKRRDHDRWIAQQESTTTSTDSNFKHSSQTYSNSKPARISSTASALGDFFVHVLRNWFWYLIGIGFVLNAVNPKQNSPPPPGPKPYEAQPKEPVKPSYIKPVSAPNGEPWPVKAAYIPGYKKLHSDGLSKVMVDNSQNDTEVFVKLVSLDGPKAYPVRQFYIPGHSSFTVNKVRAGNYDVRCRYLDNGRLSRSESFTLKETETETGIRFSNLELTLYKVKDGNMKSFDLAEDEF